MKNDKSEHHRKDSTVIKRLTKTIGFTARIESYWYNLNRIKHHLGLFKYLKEKMKHKSLLNKINKELELRGISPSNWDKTENKCVSNISIQKIGLLDQLKEYIRDVLGKDLRHILENNGKNAYYLPLDFSQPFMIDNIFIGSSVALLREIREIEPHIMGGLNKSDIDKKFPNFLDISTDDLTKFETRYNKMEDMWLKLGVVILKKLASLSIENKMPIIFV